MTKKWLIPVVSICVLGGLTFGIKAWHTYQTTEIIKEESVGMSKFSLEDIVGIEIRDDETKSFIKTNEKWQDEKRLELQYNQKEMDQLVQQISHLTAKATIRNVQDLAVYGINEYARMITVYNAAGEKQDIVIGKHDSDQNAYYVWCPENELLGLVPEGTLSMVISNTGEWIDEEVPDVKIEELNKLEIMSKEKAVIAVAKDEDGWYMEKPYHNTYGVLETAVKDYLDIINQLTKQKFVADLTDEEAYYGFKEPSFVIKINDEIVLKCGNSKDGMNLTFIK